MWRASVADRDRMAQALHWMAHAGLASSADNIDWMLTDAACAHLKALRLLHMPQKVFEPTASKNIPVEKKSKLQLMFHMHLDGWHMQVRSRQLRRSKRPPNFCGAPDEQKVYWVHEISQVLHREYLLCLLKAAEIEGGVPHLLSKGAYCNLLEGKPVRTRRRAEAFATLEVGQAVHTALPALHAAARRQRHRQTRTTVAGTDRPASAASQGSSSERASSDSDPDDVVPAEILRPPAGPSAGPDFEEGKPETQTGMATEVTVKSQFDSSVPTTELQDTEKLVDLHAEIATDKYVESRAGGLVDGCGHEGCYMEASCACPACFVMLCDFHNGLWGPQHLTSRCHEHNPGEFARLLCPCPECRPTPVTQPQQVASEENKGQQQSHASSTPSSSSSASSASSSSSSSRSSTDSEAGSGSAYAESSGSERIPDHPPSRQAEEPHVEEEHAARGVLLESTSFWKTCRFTVVKDKGLEVGLEVTCRDPRHHQKGLPACRRTLRFAKHGGPAQVQRLLKWWLLQSRDYGNREAHVLHCPKAPDELPTSEQLEAEQLSYLQPQPSPEEIFAPSRTDPSQCSNISPFKAHHLPSIQERRPKRQRRT